MDPLAALHITPELLRLIASIDEFKGRWTALGNLTPERLTVLRRVATIESVASSTRIEGVELTDAEVDQLLQGLQIRSFRTRDQQEVAGYGEAMELLFEVWPHMALTENHIKQMHGVMLKHAEKDQRHRGHYKTVPNHVVAFDADGHNLGVVFQTATPFDTPKLMCDLVTWAELALKSPVDHPLIVIAVFIVRFLAIHPFQDGNGRLSRILTTLLLLRAGYAYVPYSSLERVIEQNKEEYYRSLRAAQTTLDRGDERLNSWLVFFLRCLDSQRLALQRKIDRERLMEPLSELSARILTLAKDHGRVNNQFLVAATGTSRNTIKVHVKGLVQANLLEQRGAGRGTWYEPANRARAQEE